MRAKARKIEQAIQQLEQRLMRAPTEAEIAQQLELPLNEYQALLHDAQGVQIVHYEDFTTDADTGPGAQSDWSATLNHGSATGNPLDSCWRAISARRWCTPSTPCPIAKSCCCRCVTSKA